ncbi:DUF2059 domain-containing protein [Roseateles chitosanitabidus]|uniref:DUF2059 domain-containing protein n=1 Tax=Roseateles chitosanitabidus TaxID=65048 RepID=UPI0008344DC9|nr:DUF2059 domain-containing protein [Roseateles chitosanitabidus]MBO9685262.1 DUF2059 domain-containing protein [Roseateles chitosanitabidus]
MLKTVQAGLVAAALLASPIAFAQKADSSPAKKDLIARILKLQQPAIEALTIGVLSRPVNELAAKAAPALRNVPEAKREAVAKQIDADLRKFMDDNGPGLVDKGKVLVPQTMGVALDEKFTEDELKQLVAWLESPVSKKFAESAQDLQTIYTKKLIDDNGKQLDEKFTALQQNVAKQLGMDGGPAAPASGAKAAPKTTPKK